MPQVLNLVSLPTQAGLNSAAPPTFIAPDELAVADNVYYGLSGERRKRLGTTKYNTVATSSTHNITALADFWRFGTSLTPTQKLVATAGTEAWQSNGGGTWTSLGTFGTNTSLISNITIAQGFAVFSNGVDAPQTWDQTTFQALAASAPKFTAASYHLRRLFAIGTAATPSQVDISAGGAITTWTGADTANFVLDEDDGDAAIGISRTFHKRIYVFKGPNLGSIHEIAGNTLSTLTRDRVFTGLPAQNHHGIITTQNDIYWISQFGVHSLETTQNYGDTISAFLSLPIQNTFQNDLNLNQIKQADGFWNPYLGIVGWMVTPSGASTNQWALIYHYLLSDPTPRGKKFWSIWKFSGLAGSSAATIVTPQAQSVGPGQWRLYIGGSADGTVYSADQPTLSDFDGTKAYTTTVKTGILLDMGPGGNAGQEKSFFGVTTFFEPVGSHTHNLTMTVDNRDTATTITMSGVGDTLG